MVLTTKECLERYGTYYAIRKKMAQRRLFKLEPGVYTDRDEYVPEEKIIAVQYPNAIFTMESAFLYHDLSDVVPDTYSLATEARTAPIEDSRVKHYFVPQGTLNIGRMQLEHNGVTVTVYDLERMLIELVRYKNKLPFDYYKEIINSYRNNTDRLYPAKLDDYLTHFPRRDAISRTLDAEVF